jgi:hypothetical protein
LDAGVNEPDPELPNTTRSPERRPTCTTGTGIAPGEEARLATAPASSVGSAGISRHVSLERPHHGATLRSGRKKMLSRSFNPNTAGCLAVLDAPRRQVGSVGVPASLHVGRHRADVPQDLRELTGAGLPDEVGAGEAGREQGHAQLADGRAVDLGHADLQRNLDDAVPEEAHHLSA